jgi:hypothetical protein
LLDLCEFVMTLSSVFFDTAPPRPTFGASDRRFVAAASMFVVAFVATAGCDSVTISQPERQLRVVMNPWPGYATFFHLAEEQGFFRDEGLSLRFMELENYHDDREQALRVLARRCRQNRESIQRSFESIRLVRLGGSDQCEVFRGDQLRDAAKTAAEGLSAMGMLSRLPEQLPLDGRLHITEL